MLQAKHCHVDNTAEVISPANGTDFTKEELEQKLGGPIKLATITESGEIIAALLDQNGKANKNLTTLYGSPIYGDGIVGPAKLFKGVQK